MSEFQIGQYKIESTLGRGGMGTVYAARHESLMTRCAIKVLHDEVAKDEASRGRFEREAIVMHRLGQECEWILPIEDFRKDDGGVSWMRMPLIEGVPGRQKGERWVTLRDRMKAEGQLPEDDVIEIVRQILTGLSHAHEQGILHRDLKPENILLTDSGIRIADFGLAGVMDEEMWRSRLEKSVGDTLSGAGVADLDEENTYAGSAGSETAALLGTFGYMAPEVKPPKSEAHSVESDLYAVGLMAFQMLTGESEGGYELPSELREGLDEAWDEWVKRAMALRVDRRYGSAEAMAGSLPVVAGARERVVVKVPPLPLPEAERVGVEEDEEGEAEAVASEGEPAASPGKSGVGREVGAEEAEAEETSGNAGEGKGKGKLGIVMGSVLLFAMVLVGWQWLGESGGSVVDEARVVERSSESKTSGADTGPEEVMEETTSVSEGSEAGEERTIGGIELVWCPPGTFTMGSPGAEEGHNDDEVQHEVTLTQGFWLAKYECTQGQWEEVMETDVAAQKAKGNSYGDVTGVGREDPMYFVSWEDAKEWIAKMNEDHPPGEGWEWSLPTEAQWEYACRAGGEHEGATAYGDRLSSEQANFDGNYPYGGASKGPYLERTAEVGSYAPNGWGLHDMHGNVWEWCRDWYGEYPSEAVTDPTGASDGSNRVVRGGSWFSFGHFCRSAKRDRLLPGDRSDLLGFRPAVSSTR